MNNVKTGEKKKQQKVWFVTYLYIERKTVNVGTWASLYGESLCLYMSFTLCKLGSHFNILDLPGLLVVYDFYSFIK